MRFLASTRDVSEGFWAEIRWAGRPGVPSEPMPRHVWSPPPAPTWSPTGDDWLTAGMCIIQEIMQNAKESCDS